MYIPYISKQGSTLGAHLHSRLNDGIHNRSKLRLSTALLLIASKAGLKGCHQLLQLMHDLSQLQTRTELVHKANDRLQYECICMSCMQ